MNNKNKVYIFKYDPDATLKRMFADFDESWKTGKKNIQPKNVMVSNSLVAIYSSITPSRFQIFTCLVEKKPNNLTELARLLSRDYGNVWKDCQSLQSLEIIKLKKQGKEIQPIALYDRIIFDLDLHKGSERTISPVSVIAKQRQKYA